MPVEKRTNAITRVHRAYAAADAVTGAISDHRELTGDLFARAVMIRIRDVLERELTGELAPRSSFGSEPDGGLVMTIRSLDVGMLVVSGPGKFSARIDLLISEDEHKLRATASFEVVAQRAALMQLFALVVEAATEIIRAKAESEKLRADIATAQDSTAP